MILWPDYFLAVRNKIILYHWTTRDIEISTRLYYHYMLVLSIDSCLYIDILSFLCLFQNQFFQAFADIKTISFHLIQSRAYFCNNSFFLSFQKDT